MLIDFPAFESYLKEKTPMGVFADTSILFAATYPFDAFNEDAEKIFQLLSKQSIPTFLSVSVRAEFLENHRRVFIAESLIDFLDDMEDDIEGPLLLKLQSHRTSYRRKIKEEKNVKIDAHQIKSFRALLSNFNKNNIDGWSIFCRNYIKPQLTPLWADVCRLLNVNFISTRSEDHTPFLNELPTWEKAIELMGDYGLSSSDAMILNMFLCSKIPILLTADKEMADCIEKESKEEKFVFLPSHHGL